MPTIQRVTVYCGSRSGERPAYAEAARRLAHLCATTGVGIVYGGASVGLMGVLADAALREGGTVVGVLPGPLVEREIAHTGLSELVIVPTMHERKAKMHDLGDAFIAMPGGFGTYDELFEALTWAQVGLHQKPIGLLDVDGYFQPFLQMVTRGVSEGFIAPEHALLIVSDPDPEKLLDKLRDFEPPVPAAKWEAKVGG